MASALPSWTGADDLVPEAPRGPQSGFVLAPGSREQADHSMTKAPKLGAKIDKLMELAERTLKETHYFECEQRCIEALLQAHAAHDYERMARVLMPLQECRRQIRLQAIDSGKLKILNEPMSEGWVPTTGCWLVEPPLVAADARELRERAQREEIAVTVLAREPITKTKKLDAKGAFHAWPVVLIGPVTMRTYTRPPKGEKATINWFIEAGEQLGDWAISSIDAESEATRRVDELMNRLMAIPDHEKLHQALELACREAVVEVAKLAAAGGTAKSRAAAKEALETEEEDDGELE